MAVFFNGVDLASNFFNGVDLTNIFFNGVEVFTSEETEIPAKLVFDGVQDWYIITGEENPFNIPSEVEQDEFFYGCTIIVPTEIPLVTTPFLGRSSTALVPFRYQLQFSDGGDLECVGGLGTIISSFNLIQRRGGERIEISVRYIGDLFQLIVDGDVINTSSVTRPVDAETNFFLGCGGDVTGASIANYSDIELITWFFGEEEFRCNEGSGLIVTGELGTEGLIFRSSMWEIIPTEFKLDFDGIEDFYIIPGTENAFNMPATGEFTFGGLITFSQETPTSQRGFFGKSSQTDEPWSYYFKFQGNGNLRLWVAGQFTNYGGFLPEFAGQTLFLEGRVTAGNDLQILVDGVVITQDPIAFRAEDNAGVNWFIGCMGNSAGTGIQNFYDLQMLNWYHQEEFFPLNEGTGLIVTGLQGTEGVINRDSQWRGQGEFKLVFDLLELDRVSLSKAIIPDDVLKFKFRVTTEQIGVGYLFSDTFTTTLRAWSQDGLWNFTGCTLTSFKVGGLDVPLNSNINDFTGQLIEVEFLSSATATLSKIGARQDNTLTFDALNLENYDLDEEFFPCNEGDGLTTIGSEGTICTISRVEMWEEIVPEFKLNFESIESDDLTGSSSPSNEWATLGDIKFNINFNNFERLATSDFFVKGLDTQNEIRIHMNGAGNFSFFARIDNVLYFNESLSINLDQQHNFNVENGIATLDGDLFVDFTGVASQPTNGVQFADWGFSQRFGAATVDADFELLNFDLGDENFPCNEGDGLTVTGDQGTIGTITRVEMWEPTN